MENVRQKLLDIEGSQQIRLLGIRRALNHALLTGGARKKRRRRKENSRKSYISYWGSKRRVASAISQYMLPAFNAKRKTFVEPFCGTAYMSTYLMRTVPRGVVTRYMLSDRNADMVALLKALKKGWLPSYQRVSQKTWNAWKASRSTSATKTFYGILHGFGGMLLNGSKPRLFPGTVTDTEGYVRRTIATLKETHGCLASHRVNISEKSFDEGTYRDSVIYLDPPYVCGGSVNARCWKKNQYDVFLSQIREWLKPALNNRVFLSGALRPHNIKGLRFRKLWSQRVFNHQSSKHEKKKSRHEILWECVRG